MITVATWNVNSVKARLEHLVAWLQQSAPDVVLLQETKVIDDLFPRDEISDLGYNAAVNGQKTYNGVAVLSKQPIEVLQKGLPGDPSDHQSRYLEVFTCGLRVAALYVPNGNPVGTEKFSYKIAWLRRLHQHVRELLETEDAFILGGDFNIAPFDADVYDPQRWRDDALCKPECRQALRRISHLGLTDAIPAAAAQAGPHYTWWDYRGGAFSANEGLRIDHLMLSPQAADRLDSASVDCTPRSWERPSDHAPVSCSLRGPRPT